MAGLVVKGLCKSFGNNRVLNNISFEVPNGEFCVLLGPSGCGKSTILRLIAGLEQQNDGEIFIGDAEVSDLTPKDRDIAMVFQSYALYPHMNVYENMAFSLEMKKTSKKDIRRKVKKVAGLLEIEELLSRKPKELSGGQRQRVAIGRAIVRNPKLFLFDEPLSNLDAKLRTAMRVELARLHQRLKSTIVYVTHDQTEAMTLGQKIILLNMGRIQQIGTPQDMYEKPSNIFAATFIGSPQINLIEGSISIVKGRMFFESGALKIDMDHRRELRDYAARVVTIGIRPEALLPGDGYVKGRVEHVEHLGSETIVYTTVGGTKITAKVLPDFRKSTGEGVTFSLSDKGVHFFYNGVRIVGQSKI